NQFIELSTTYLALLEQSRVAHPAIPSSRKKSLTFQKRTTKPPKTRLHLPEIAKRERLKQSPLLRRKWLVETKLRLRFDRIGSVFSSCDSLVRLLLQFRVTGLYHPCPL